MNRDVQSFLPYDFNNGIVWIKAINEDNLRSVKIYDVSEEGISVVENYISKSQIMEELKAVPKKAGYKISQENKIVSVWRYYYNNTLIKEIIVYPQEWE
jgi:bifunctional DNA-binding transcriptional regulator/antitoxin component of YhaV-PrlF toxin-antitoxin module